MYQGQTVEIDIRKIRNESISSKVSKTKSDSVYYKFHNVGIYTALHGE